MCFEFEFDTEFFESRKAPWLSSKSRKHGISLPGITKRQTYLKSNNSFAASPRATYSASDVERVTHFQVLENQHTHVSPDIIAPFDTDLLSIALLASAETSRESTTDGCPSLICKAKTRSTIIVYENTKRCFPVDGFRRGIVPRNRSNCVGVIGACRNHQPH